MRRQLLLMMDVAQTLYGRSSSSLSSYDTFCWVFCVVIIGTCTFCLLYLVCTTEVLLGTLHPDHGVGVARMRSRSFSRAAHRTAYHCAQTTSICSNTRLRLRSLARAGPSPVIVFPLVVSHLHVAMFVGGWLGDFGVFSGSSRVFSCRPPTT
jgi:hypothetical protein